MKLILFIIIIIIVVFIFVVSRIKLYHRDILPTEQQIILKNRAKIRKMLLSNSIKVAPENDTKIYENFSQIQALKNSTNSLEYPNYQLPNDSELIGIINSDYVDSQYKFNTINLPVTTRCPNKKMSKQDNIYIYLIESDIIKWNSLFNQTFNIIKPEKINLLLITETEAEFILKADAKIIYTTKKIYVELNYYGRIKKSDDFFNNFHDTYYVQLFDIRQISKDNFKNTKKNSNFCYNPFITMDEQLAYVKKINDMHKLM